jgi:oligopeptide transport system ATP-binding protein
MYLGRLVEVANRDALFANPQHPYTQALLAAVPVPNPEIEASRPQQIIVGEVPSVRNPPPGCRFHPRCPHAMDVCRRTAPPLSKYGETHVACHLMDPATAGADVRAAADEPLAPRV